MKKIFSIILITMIVALGITVGNFVVKNIPKWEFSKITKNMVNNKNMLSYTVKAIEVGNDSISETSQLEFYFDGVNHKTKKVEFHGSMEESIFYNELNQDNLISYRYLTDYWERDITLGDSGMATLEERYDICNSFFLFFI